MAPQFPHKAQQAENRWLSPLLSSLLAAVSLIVTVDLASLAVAAECQLIEEEGETIQGMPTWKGHTSSLLPLTITVERDMYKGLVLSPVLGIIPNMNNSRFAWDNTVNQEIAAIGVCSSLDIRKSARTNQSVITSIGKTQAKAHRQGMKVSTLPYYIYKGEKQVHTIRTTPLEIGISPRDKASTLIGPVQETQKPVLSDERSVSRSVAALPITVDSLFLSGGQSIVGLNLFQNTQQLPGNESLRMNLTTTQVLHEGNCSNGCP
jgi:hypothetical protein